MKPKPTIILIVLSLLFSAVSAQTLSLLSPVPVSVEVDKRRSGVHSTQWKLNWSGRDSTRISLYSTDDSLLISRTIPAHSEPVMYEVDTLASGQYKLYFRRGMATLPVPTVNPEHWDYIPAPPADDVIQIYPAQRENLTQTNTLDSLLQTLTTVRYEYEKVRRVVAWSEKNNPSVEDIRRLSDAASYATSKLTLIQALYPYCSNPAVYGTLADLFEFQATKNDFNTWLIERQKVH